MPELSAVINDDEKDKKKVNASIVDATVIDEINSKNTQPKTTKKKTDTKTSAKKSIPKPVAKKPEPTKSKPEVATKKVDAITDVENPEPKLQRPPLEMLTQDIQHYILEQNICGTDIAKLEYKCGKIIFGIKNNEGKDFRVMAFKARKKTKSVAGKSRGIYYFGMTKDLKVITKTHTGTSTTDFGKCSVQVKKPIQLILDKTTFDENFNQDAEIAMATLKKLVDLCILHKEEQWNEMTEKKQTKTKAAQEKETTKKLAAEKKATAIANAKNKKDAAIAAESLAATKLANKPIDKKQ